MDGVDRVIDQLYDGALDAAAWPAAFASLCDFLDADHAIGMVRDGGSSSFPLVAAARIDPANVARFVDAAPGAMALLQGFSERRSFDFSSVVPRDHFVRSDFFQDVIRPMGGYRAMMTVPFRQRGYDSFVAVCRPERAREFGEAETAMLERIVPHITRAMRVRLRIDSAEMRMAAALVAFDQIDTGLAIVDSAMRPIVLNRRAEQALASRDGLALSQRALGPTDAAMAPVLREFVKRAAADDPRAPGSYALVLRRGGGRPPWSVTVRRLDPKHAPPVGGLVALLFEDVARLPADVAPMLAAIFRLTPREAALAAALTRGVALADAADQLGITTGTARVYLKSIFAKTHTRRQGELVSLILRLTRFAG